jgi:hypothetical protein
MDNHGLELLSVFSFFYRNSSQLTEVLIRELKSGPLCPDLLVLIWLCADCMTGHPPPRHCMFPCKLTVSVFRILYFPSIYTVLHDLFLYFHADFRVTAMFHCFKSWPCLFSQVHCCTYNYIKTNASSKQAFTATYPTMFTLSSVKMSPN